MSQAERTNTVLRSGRFDHVKVKTARELIDGSVDLSTPPITRRFYGGCKGGLGHYLFDIYGKKHYRDNSIPWGEAWDGLLQPKHTTQEGQAVIHYKREDGGPIWTAISFWDYTVDKRPGSSSNFFFDSHLSFANALADATVHWPQIFARFPFKVEDASI